MKPSYAGNEVAECVAHDVRHQLTGGDDRILALDLEQLQKIQAVRVNGVSYELEWSFDGEVTDDEGQPVFGVCEVDPGGLPDTTCICVNPEPVNGREELMRSTAFHELAHGVFEAPAWIYASQKAALPSLFEPDGASVHHRVWRTTTKDEQHFTEFYPRGSPEFFRETRANCFMGAAITPRRLLSRQFAEHCERFDLKPGSLGQNALPSLTSVTDADGESKGNLHFFNRYLQIQQIVDLLAADFAVSRRFVEVRLQIYGLVSPVPA
jgi:hypothetical protein